MRIGIMSAMNEEIDLLVTELEKTGSTTAGMRTYHEGKLWGADAVLAFSHWGKVASATTATHLITNHKIDALLFTGVAGGVAADVRVSDVIVGTELYQHDMDARPIFQRHEVPFVGVSVQSDRELSAELEAAAKKFLKTHSPSRGQVRVGAIASGDQFFSSREKIIELRERLPQVLCVEMEGASVAQVCHEYGVPFGIVRTISDTADENAPAHFQEFIQNVARVYSHGILREWVSARKLQRSP